MSERQFSYKRFTYELGDGFKDMGNHLSSNDVLNLLNGLYEENKKLKKELFRRNY